MSFINRRLGKFTPIEQRTKLWQEFSGITIKMWLWMPLRVITLLPLMAFYKLTITLADGTDNLYDYLNYFMSDKGKKDF